MVALHANSSANRSEHSASLDTAFGTMMRGVVAARVSTEDQQDPTLSIPRQYRVSVDSTPPGGRIVGCFYDIDSGRKDVAVRGVKMAHEAFDIPVRRDGGIRDLLAEAKRPDRRFDFVICESISRISRDTHEGTGIERELERCGVMLLAADEGPVLMHRRWGKATALLMRRMKQIVAEYEVRNMLEQSWNGLVDHTLQGWNSGRPGYGFLGDKLPHPVPARRAEGDTKTRLVIDPVRAPIVAQMFQWRVGQRMSFQAIADRLNRDLNSYPPPDCNNAAARRGEWTRANVEGILRNPKYTGYMVWNRRTQPGGGRERWNAPSEWVWSAEPTHEPIIPRELYDAAQAVARERAGSRWGDALSRHPQARRTYRLRSFVMCGHADCGRRMAGSTVRGRVYYVCMRRPPYQTAVDGHEQRVYAPEALIMPIVGEFFASRIFGADRQDLMQAAIAATGEDDPRRQRDDRLKALRRAADDLGRRLERLVRSIEETDDSGVARNLQGRISELERERADKLAQVAGLEAMDPMVGREVSLLDELPMVNGWDVTMAPEATLRRLLEAFRLRVRYWNRPRSVDVAVTLDDDSLAGLRDLLADVAGAAAPRQAVRRPEPPGAALPASGRREPPAGAAPPLLGMLTPSPG